MINTKFNIIINCVWESEFSHMIKSGGWKLNSSGIPIWYLAFICAGNVLMYIFLDECGENVKDDYKTSNNKAHSCIMHAQCLMKTENHSCPITRLPHNKNTWELLNTHKFVCDISGQAHILQLLLKRSSLRALYVCPFLCEPLLWIFPVSQRPGRPPTPRMNS